MGDYLNFDIQGFLQQAGSSPFYAMWFLFVNGGWVIFLYAFLWTAVNGWLHWRQNISGSQKEWIVLSISIPKFTEKDPGQSLSAVENIFAHLAGAHSPSTWTEKWMQGKYQDPISLEIISIDGRVQFVIRCLRQLRDLVEASIFAQYPTAEMSEVEDYAKAVPQFYPDRDWDLYGTEMVPVKPTSFYPLKTYPEFEHSISGELKDPISVLLEAFSRLGPGEQAWLQILALPIDQKEYQDKGVELIKKLKGEVTVKPPSLLEKIVLGPFEFFFAILNTIISSPSAAPVKGKEANPLQGKMFNLSPGERKVLEAVENKVSKIGFLSKMRFVYVAKKNVFKKPRIVSSFVGYVKQMNTNNMLALKPEAKYVGMNGGLWLFNQRRNNFRKNRMISNYRNRSVSYGMPPFHLCTEELATIWHFPHTFQVKAPQLQKHEVRSAEPPINLPIG